MMSGSAKIALVTGSSGFIGRSLERHLKSAGMTVIAPHRAELDLLERQAVHEFVAARTPDVVFNMASRGVFSNAIEDELLVQSECAMVEHLLCAMAPGTLFIQAGSMAEYGRSGRHRENSQCTPRTAYGRAKFEAGQHALALADAGRLEVCVARLFGVYGPGEAPRRLFPYVRSALASPGTVALSDGRQERDFVHVDDVCRALMLLSVRGNLPSIINIGTGKAVSVRDAVRRVALEWGYEEDRLQFGTIPRSTQDESLLEADVTLLAHLLDWVPPQHFLSAEQVAPLIEAEHGIS